MSGQTKLFIYRIFWFVLSCLCLFTEYFGLFWHVCVYLQNSLVCPDMFVFINRILWFVLTCLCLLTEYFGLFWHVCVYLQNSLVCPDMFVFIYRIFWFVLTKYSVNKHKHVRTNQNILLINTNMSGQTKIFCK
jgi:hypothetical protein